MKHILKTFVVSMALMLSACGGAAPALDGEVEGNQFMNSDVSFIFPDNWEPFLEFSDEYPDNTLFVARNNVKNRDFVGNINLSYAIIDSEINAKTYAEQMLATHKDTLTNFTKRSSNEMEITVNGSPATTVLNVFQGKQDDSKELIFYQTYAYKDEVMYVLTGVTHVNDDAFVREKLENSVRSIQVLK